MMNSAEPPNRTVPDDVLTPRQRKIIQSIEEYSRDHGCSPSNREIAEGAGLASPSSVNYHLRALKAAGIVSYDAACPRTVRVLQPGPPATPPADGTGESPGGPEPAAGETPAKAGPGKVVWVPIAGRIAAGGPITAEQSIEDYLPLPREVVGGDEGLFILEVVGDSMIGVGIFPGDLVVVCPLFQPPRNGDIVAATIDGVELEGTIKTYMKLGRHVWLMPQNPAYTPIPGGKAKFVGKVVAVLRRV
jgi:repressor LexA